MQEKDKKDWTPFIQHWQREGPKYLPALKNWCDSREVQTQWKYETEVIGKSKLFRKLVEEVYDVRDLLVKAARDQKFGKKMTKAGIVEWADNETLGDIFEEVYDIKEAYKALVMSKMGQTDRKMTMASYGNKEFRVIWNYLKKDMGFKNVEDLKRQIRNKLREIRAGLKKCPYAQEIKQRVMKLMHTIEQTRKVSDVPSEREFNEWVAENKFQPWE